jgi:hypothetical protein
MANWLDKYEQGGLVLKKKTKDNYGKKANPNDVKVSAGPDFVGEGYTAYNWKSPSWGGRFQMGGSMPGAVGFTYARVAGSAPANGKYTKKTKASAQNGQEMKFYQEGLDFKPKTISKNGSVIKDDMGQWAHPGEITQIGSNEITMKGVDYPVLGISDTGDTKMMKPGKDYKFDGNMVTEYPLAQKGRTLPDVTVTSKADPRFKAYQDSLALYNASIDMGKKGAEALAKDYYKKDVEYTKMAKDYNENKEQYNKFVKSRYKDNLDFYNKTLVDPITKGTKPKFGGLYKYDKDAADRFVIEEDILNKGMHNYLTDNDRIEKGYYKHTLDSYKGFKKLNKNIKPVKYLRNAELFPIPVYKKPVQPVKYQKPEPARVVEKQPIPKQPTPQPKPLYEYEGESVMAPTPGGGGGAMVGVRKKDGTVEYIRPEDYQRMGVPKYGQDYIKSKQKMKDGGWLNKYK